MKHLNKCITLILSLAFLMSVGACDRHSGRGRVDSQSGKDSLNQEESVNDTAKTAIVKELTKEQKDSIAKARQDSIIKAKQDSANQVVVNEIARRIKEMPDSVLDRKLADVTSLSKVCEEEISTLKTYIYVLAGILLLVILIIIRFVIKTFKDIGDLFNKFTGNDSSIKGIQKDLDGRNRPSTTKTTSSTYDESSIEKILNNILEKKGITPSVVLNTDPYRDLYEKHSTDCDRDENHNGTKSKGRSEKEKEPRVPNSSKEIIYLGLPINNQYFRAEEKGDSNCFIAEILKSGNSGFFNLISLDRIKSDTISSSVLNITGKVKLSDASDFETIAEGKIVKADDFWKVEVPLTILIS